MDKEKLHLLKFLLLGNYYYIKERNYGIDQVELNL